MKHFEKNKKIWSDIYKTGASNLAYPNETLVRYLYYLYPNKNFHELKVLDYGFGSGNNLIHLDNLSCDVFGAEISEDAKKLTLKKIRDDFDEKKLFVIRQETQLPYENECFDLIISWQVLYYNTIESLNTTLNNLIRVLKPGGKFIGTMMRMEDVSAINSTPISKYERISTDAMGNQSGSFIIGLPSEDDVKSLFSQFKNIKVGYFETKINDIVGSHWVIYGEK
jgi:SAM-dependent methyltransferase